MKSHRSRSKSRRSKDRSPSHSRRRSRSPFMTGDLIHTLQVTPNRSKKSKRKKSHRHYSSDSRSDSSSDRSRGRRCRSRRHKSRRRSSSGDHCGREGRSLFKHFLEGERVKSRSDLAEQLKAFLHYETLEVIITVVVRIVLPGQPSTEASTKAQPDLPSECQEPREFNLFLQTQLRWNQRKSFKTNGLS